MKIYSFEELNERYKTPKNLNFEYLLKLEYTYVDNVFDNIFNIICEENNISEKNFKKIDNVRNYLESYFDNNQEILLEIDKLKNKDYRYNYIAEILYDKYFKKSKELL